MAMMNQIKQGENLLHPKPSAGWIVSAVVAMAVLGVAYWLYNKAKSTVTGSKVSQMTSGLESQATKQLEGFL
jgi:drug/metabolite transporter (DMT)-like permease